MSSTTPNLPPSNLKISQGHDESRILPAVQTLTFPRPGKLPWKICNQGKGLEREFNFKTFKTTWEFMSRIATHISSTTRHHPEWSNVYNRVHIRWTTHNPEGLSAKDVEMAGVCDEVAGELGEVVPEKGNGEGEGMRGLLEERMGLGGGAGAGDCCGGREK